VSKPDGLKIWIFPGNPLGSQLRKTAIFPKKFIPTQPQTTLEPPRKPFTTMLQKGILNPDVLHLLARIRHTNSLVIADWAFPYWDEVETVDLTLCRGIPTITDLLDLLHDNFKVGQIWQAEEFLTTNPGEVIQKYDTSFNGFTGLYPKVEVTRLPHNDFKKMIPNAIGLIRTGDTTAYGNVILESV
jgi:D-ribose pyranase